MYAELRTCWHTWSTWGKLGLHVKSQFPGGLPFLLKALPLNWWLKVPVGGQWKLLCPVVGRAAHIFLKRWCHEELSDMTFVCTWALRMVFAGWAHGDTGVPVSMAGFMVTLVLLCPWLGSW